MTLRVTYVLISFMTDDAANPGPTLPTDPSSDRQATAPTRIGRVLTVVRMLIGYGKELADAIQRRAGQPLFATAMLPFGTLDPAVILARIACGLRRAAALEERLTAYAARGRDLPAPQPESKAALPAATAPHEPAPPAPRPKRAPPADPAGLPTAEQIAAEVRRRPIGAVVADICRDLGLVPGQCDSEFWNELSHIIAAHGGTLSRWVDVIEQRIRQCLTFSRDHADAASTSPLSHAPRPDAVGTGPPLQPDFATTPA